MVLTGRGCVVDLKHHHVLVTLPSLHRKENNREAERRVPSWLCALFNTHCSSQETKTQSKHL